VRDDEELVRSGEGEWTEENAADDGEHRRVRADPERKRENGDGREERRASQRTYRVAEVERETLEPHPAPGFARRFFNVRNITELAPGGGECVVRRLAARDAIGDGHREVRADLFIEQVVSLVARVRPGKPHDSPSGCGGCMMPAMAWVNCSHLLRSSASCLRPAAVSV
jgi:hypothetical protein